MKIVFGQRGEAERRFSRHSERELSRNPLTIRKIRRASRKFVFSRKRGETENARLPLPPLGIRGVPAKMCARTRVGEFYKEFYSFRANSSRWRAAGGTKPTPSCFIVYRRPLNFPLADSRAFRLCEKAETLVLDGVDDADRGSVAFPLCFEILFSNIRLTKKEPSCSCVRVCVCARTRGEFFARNENFIRAIYILFVYLLSFTCNLIISSSRKYSFLTKRKTIPKRIRRPRRVVKFSKSFYSSSNEIQIWRL